MHLEESQETSPAQHKKGSKKITIVVVVALIIAGGLCGGAAVASLLGKQITIPPQITQKLIFTPYLPGSLPGNYAINNSSFSLQDDGVLVFSASDGTGTSIAFTEQKKPSKLNFTDFYHQHMTDTRTLSNVPFPSVVGKSAASKGKVLSVVADDTWIFVSTKSPLSNQDLQVIAESLRAKD